MNLSTPLFPLPRLVSCHNVKSSLTLGHYPAIFLDRDGTINVDKDYIFDPYELELIPNSAKAMKILKKKGYYIIIITNQSGIERGIISPQAWRAVNQQFWQLLQNENAIYDALYYCPHHPNYLPSCCCRKPAPGMILQAACDFDIDLRCSYFIGDKLSDVAAGNAAGCKSILVRTGYGASTQLPTSLNSCHMPFAVANDLYDAIQNIPN